MCRRILCVVTVRWLAQGMDDVPETPGWLSSAEAARLEGLRFPKRRTELRLSRWTAKQTIARVSGLDVRHETLARIEVRPAPDGAPEPLLDGRPAPVSVSMTDRADWAVCVAGPPGSTLGCDLELVEARSPAFVRDWFTPREQALVAGGDPDLLANLVWSAKESVLKVLHTGLRRATRSVEVDVHTDGDGWARFTVRADVAEQRDRRRRDGADHGQSAGVEGAQVVELDEEQPDGRQ